MKKKILLLSLWMIQSLIDASNISVNSRFDPEKVNLGEEVQYIVEITNTFPSSFQVPKVDGLRKISQRTYQSSSNINGKISEKISFIIGFQATKEGALEMPAFDISAAGEAITIPASKVTVVNDPNFKKQQQAPSGVRLVLALDKDNAYVGEKIPVKIALCLDGDIQLLSNIQIRATGNDFIADELSKQPISSSSGRTEIFTWTSAITPVKSGALNIQFDVDCTLQITQGFGGNSLFSGLFTVVEPVQKTISTNPVELTVAALPSPTPNNFTGGIGDYGFSDVKISSDRALVGEPITVSAILSGKGNFDRIQAPALTSDDQWKCFEPKCSIKADTNGNPQKMIEYVMIPQKPGAIALPKIALSYFSLEHKEYKEIVAPTDNLTVLVSRSSEDLAPSQYTENNTETKTTSALHLITQDTKSYATLQHIGLQKLTWEILSGIFILLLVILILNCLKNYQKKHVTKRNKVAKFDPHKSRAELIKLLQADKLVDCYRKALDLAGRVTNTGSNRNELLNCCKKLAPNELNWLETFLAEADDVIFGGKKVLRLYATQQIDRLIKIIQILRK